MRWCARSKRKIALLQGHITVIFLPLLRFARFIFCCQVWYTSQKQQNALLKLHTFADFLLGFFLIPSFLLYLVLWICESNAWIVKRGNILCVTIITWKTSYIVDAMRLGNTSLIESKNTENFSRSIWNAYEYWIYHTLCINGVGSISHKSFLKGSCMRVRHYPHNISEMFRNGVLLYTI